MTVLTLGYVTAPMNWRVANCAYRVSRVLFLHNPATSLLTNSDNLLRFVYSRQKWADFHGILIAGLECGLVHERRHDLMVTTEHTINLGPRGRRHGDHHCARRA